MDHIVIVAGGSPKYWPDMTEYSVRDTFWIGVDRGAWFLLEQGITPDIAVGDFDSLTASEWLTVSTSVSEVVKAPAEKDETDTQLALSIALAQDATAEIILIGGTGGRMDHLLANFWLMSEPRFAAIMPRFKLLDNQNTVMFYRPGNYQLTKEKDKPYIGFICPGVVTNLTLTGFKYGLTDHSVTYPVSFASNEFLANEGTFSFATGQLVVIQSKDK